MYQILNSEIHSSQMQNRVILQTEKILKPYTASWGCVRDKKKWLI